MATMSLEVGNLQEAISKVKAKLRKELPEYCAAYDNVIRRAQEAKN